jgi:hypothetical protein
LLVYGSIFPGPYYVCHVLLQNSNAIAKFKCDYDQLDAISVIISLVYSLLLASITVYPGGRFFVEDEWCFFWFRDDVLHDDVLHDDVLMMLEYYTLSNNKRIMNWQC